MSAEAPETAPAADGARVRSESTSAADGVSLQAVAEEIAVEAARLRDSGALPPGFEEDLDRRFLEIASDPAALARDAAKASPFRGDSSWLRDAPPFLRPFARAALRSKRTAGTIVRSSRRLAGPRIRTIDRSSIERSGRIVESVATRGYVAADHAKRLLSERSTGRVISRLEQVSPSSRTLPPAQRRPRATEGRQAGAPPGAGAAESTGPDELDLEEWSIERLTSGGSGLIVHVECGDARIVRRLAAAGYESAGADPLGGGTAGHPWAPGPAETLVREGALEFLGGCGRSTLSGLLLSGVTERLSPGGARALAHLAASRLCPGGAVVVMSAHSECSGDDLVSADLSPGRPLHPITWCHLLSRYGLVELTVNDPADRGSSSYVVAARRPSVAP